MSFVSRYLKSSDLPPTIPVFPLTSALLLPRTELPLNIFEPRYLMMFDHVMSGDRIVGMIQPQSGDVSDVPRLSSIGCAGRVTTYSEMPDGRLQVTLTGIARFRVQKELVSELPYRQIKPNFKEFAIDFASSTGAERVDRNALLKAFRDYLDVNNMTTNWEEVEAVNTEQLVNVLSLMAPYPAEDKQALLEAPDLQSRADMLVALTELAIARQSRGKGTALQ